MLIESIVHLVDDGDRACRSDRAIPFPQNHSDRPTGKRQSTQFRLYPPVGPTSCAVGDEMRANTTPTVGRFYPSPPDDANNRGPVGFSHKKHEKSQKGYVQFLWLFVFFVAIIRDSFRRLPSRRVLSERHSC